MKGGNFWITVVEVFHFSRLSYQKLNAYNSETSKNWKKAAYIAFTNHHSSWPVTFLMFPSIWAELEVAFLSCTCFTFLWIDSFKSRHFWTCTFPLEGPDNGDGVLKVISTDMTCIDEVQTITKNSFGLSFGQRKIVEKVKKSFDYNYYSMGANLTFES